MIKTALMCVLGLLFGGITVLIIDYIIFRISIRLNERKQNNVEQE
jgi:hypothetical protein